MCNVVNRISPPAITPPTRERPSVTDLAGGTRRGDYVGLSIRNSWHTARERVLSDKPARDRSRSWSISSTPNGKRSIECHRHVVAVMQQKKKRNKKYVSNRVGRYLPRYLFFAWRKSGIDKRSGISRLCLLHAHAAIWSRIFFSFQLSVRLDPITLRCPSRAT